METSTDQEFECAVDARSNTEIESAVIRGVAAALLNGPQAGIQVMIREDVPYEIIFRVLGSETKRRASDWKLCSTS